MQSDKDFAREFIFFYEGIGWFTYYTVYSVIVNEVGLKISKSLPLILKQWFFLNKIIYITVALNKMAWYQKKVSNFPLLVLILCVFIHH